MARPIADYALIGDTHSTALVAPDGSIDWLCWPRHDSPALLTRLLDEERGGAAWIALDEAAPAGRRYAGDTNILETRFGGARGAATLTDFMPVHPPDTRVEHGPDGEAQSRVVRILTCTRGEIAGAFMLRVTPDYGAAVAEPVERDAGWRFADGTLAVAATGSHAAGREGDALAMRFRLRAGETAFFAFTHDGGEAAPALGSIAEAADTLARTRRYWSEWSAQIRYDGPHAAAVRRSALVLKLLTYSPTGAIIAAATTSLPEAVPGNRNYDYRYSWVRDASFTVTAFCNLGLVREAAEYMRFLRDADASGGERLRLLYAIEGEVPEERTLDHLPGWRGVGPVRVGNAADGQQQHDIYGEVMVALHAYLDAVDYDPPADFAEGCVPFIRTLAGHALRCRSEPDRGIWELRSDPLHLQHSKALLWVGLDRAATTAEALGGVAADEVAGWREAAAALREEYERECWNEARGAWMQSYGSDVLDAAVLRTALFGGIDPSDPRTLSTLDAVERELGDGDLVYRYRAEDGMEGEEATFTACAFWRVGVMALAGRTDEAAALFGRLLARGNDVGLFAEEIDAATGEQRGNVPQGFTHMCIINHAVRLQASRDRQARQDG